MATNITTVMGLDDKKLKQGLKDVEKAYKETYSEIGKQTKALEQYDKDLAKHKADIGQEQIKLNSELKKYKELKESDKNTQKEINTYKREEEKLNKQLISVEKQLGNEKTKNKDVLEKQKTALKENIALAKANQQALSGKITPQENISAIKQNISYQEQQIANIKEQIIQTQKLQSISRAAIKGNTFEFEDKKGELAIYEKVAADRVRIEERRAKQEQSIEEKAYKDKVRMLAEQTQANRNAAKENISIREAFDKKYQGKTYDIEFAKEKERLFGLQQKGIITEKEYQGALKQTQAELKNTEKSHGSTTNAVVRHLRQIETLIVSYYMVKTAWDATIGKGLEANKVTESSSQGIAALITANTSMITSTGKAVTAADRFSMSQTVAIDTMKKLKTASQEVYGSYEDLTMVFQQAIGHSLKMGDSFGSSVDEIADKTIQISKSMMSIAGAIGMQPDRVKEEIRSMFTGTVTTDSLIATMIFGSPSEANNALKQAKERGKNGVSDMMLGVLESFKVLEGLHTYEIQLDKMLGAYTNLMKEMAEPIFSDLTTLFSDIALTMEPEKIKEMVAGFKDFYEIFKTVGSYALVVAENIDKVALAFVAWKYQKDIMDGISKGMSGMAANATIAQKAATGLGAGVYYTAQMSSKAAEAMLNVNSSTNLGAIAMDKMRSATKGLGGALKTLAMTNAPLIALTVTMSAYELLIDSQIKKQNKLHDIYNRGIDDIKKLTAAQSQSALLLNADQIQKKKEELQTASTEAKVTKYGTAFRSKGTAREITDAEAEVNRLEAELKNLEAWGILYEKQLKGVLNLQTKVNDIKNGKGGSGAGAGKLDTKSGALASIAEYYDEVVGKSKSQLDQYQDTLKEVIEKEKLLHKDIEKTNKAILDQKNKKNKAMLQEELKNLKDGVRKVHEIKLKLNADIATEQKNDKKKQDTEEIKKEKDKYELQIQLGKENLAFQKLAITEELNINDFKLNSIQQAENENYKLELKQLEDNLAKAKNIEDKYLRDVEVSEAKTKIWDKEREHLEWIRDVKEDILKADEKQLDIIRQQANAMVKQAGKDFGYITNDVSTSNYGELKSKKSQIAKDYVAGMKPLAESIKEKFTLEEQKNIINEYKDKYIDAINKIDEELKKIGDVELNINIKGFDTISNGIAGIVNAYGDLTSQTDKYSKDMKRANGDTVTQNKLSLNYASNTVGAYANMTGAIASFYDENSTQAKKLMEMQKVMFVAQMAMEIQKQFAYGTTALASSLTLPPPASFAAYAATAAMLASLGIVVGGMISGGDKQSYSYDTLSAMADNKGTGTVLGDIEAGSNSIKNSLEILSDFAKPEYNLTSQMAKSLESIDNKIGGVTTMLLRNAGYALGDGYTGGYDTGYSNNFSISQNGASIGTLGGVYAAGATTGGVATAFTAAAQTALPYIAAGMVADKLLFDGAIMGGITSLTNKVLGGVFGKSSTSQSLTDAGLIFGNQLITTAKEDFEGSAYQTIATTVTKKSWFSKSKKTSYTTATQDMDEEIRNQFELIVNGMYESVLGTADMLDGSQEDLISRLADFEVKLGKISLKGLSGEEMQEKLSNVFGKTMDEIVTEAYAVQDFMYADFDKKLSDYQDIRTKKGKVSKSAQQQLEEAQAAYDKAKSDAHTAWLDTTKTTLDGFRKAGETISETLMRVSTGMQEAEYYIKRLGYQYDETDYKDIINQQGDAGAEALRQSLLRYEKIFYNNSTGIDEIVNILSGTAEDIYETITPLYKVREQLRYLGFDINGITLSMISGAGGVDALSSAMDDYFDKFLNPQEQLTSQIITLQDEFAKLGLSIPRSKQGFKDLVASIDTTTESGQDLFGRVILLGDAFDEAFGSSDKNILSWKNSFKTERELANDLAISIGVDLATSLESLDTLFNIMSNDSNGLTNAELELLEINKSLINSETELAKTRKDEAIKSIQTLSDVFGNLGDTIEETINNLLGNTKDAKNQDILIAKFWEKKGELDRLLIKNGDLTLAEQTSLEKIVGDINSLSMNIQGASEYDNTAITNSLVAQLENIKTELDLDNTILKTRIVDANGNDIKVSTDGVLTAFANAMASYTGVQLPSLAINGSHYNGLANVPFDGYIAELHKNERVLTSNENTNYTRNITSNISANSLSNDDVIAELRKMSARLESIEKSTKISSNVLNESQYGQRTMKVELVS